MVEVRQGRVDDASELVRLRAVMLASINGHEPAPGPWIEAAERTLRERLADPAGTLVAFVVDKPGQPGGLAASDRPAALAACVVGTVEYRLPGPSSLSGEFGHVFNVATDPACRRRGYARACMDALLDWYRQRGVSRVDLHASTDGEPLYRSLGFTDAPARAMRLLMPSRP